MPEQSEDTAPIEAHLAARRDEILETLKSFVRLPSVSTDKSFAPGIAAAAAFVAERLRVAGLSEVCVHPTPGHPIVTASWHLAPGRPTILIYGHYDVQPPDPIEAWTSPPFQPVVRDARLYGRGTSDDKGPMLIPIEVAASYMAESKALPINVVFLFEGEEESSSVNLEPFVASHKSLLAADLVVSADGAQWRADLPSVIVGSRGICSLEVTVKGAAKDLHSGRHGGSVANPIQALVKMLASLHAPNGSIAVPHFYDTVRSVSAAERQAIEAIPFDEGAYLASIGAPAGVGEAGFALLERNWLRPTLEYNGIVGGYTGPGRKTVIPSVASAKITCRLVPNQQPDEIARLVAAQLTALTPAGVTVDIAISVGGSRAYAVPRDLPGLRVAEAVLADVTGRKPARVRMGATIPIGDVFRQHLGIETVFFSFATSDEDYHAPNEFFRLQSLDRGLVAWTRLLWQLAAGR